MLKTLQNAFKVKDVRHRIFYVLMMLVVVRIGSQLPVPGVDNSYFKDWFAGQSGEAFNFSCATASCLRSEKVADHQDS